MGFQSIAYQLLVMMMTMMPPNVCRLNQTSTKTTTNVSASSRTNVKKNEGEGDGDNSNTSTQCKKLQEALLEASKRVYSRSSSSFSAPQMGTFAERSSFSAPDAAMALLYALDES